MNLNLYEVESGELSVNLYALNELSAAYIALGYNAKSPGISQLITITNKTNKNKVSYRTYDLLRNMKLTVIYHNAVNKKTEAQIAKNILDANEKKDLLNKFFAED